MAKLLKVLSILLLLALPSSAQTTNTWVGQDITGWCGVGITNWCGQPIGSTGGGEGGSGPVFESADLQSASYTSSTETNMVVNVPTNLAENDLVIVVINSSIGMRTITPPGGFTLLRRESNSTTSNFRPDTAVYWKLATASEGSTYTFSRNDSNIMQGAVYAARITGNDTSAPIDQNDGANSGSSAVETLQISAGITPTEADTLLVMVLGQGASSIASWDTIPGTTVWSVVGAPAPAAGVEDLADTSATGSRTFSWTGPNRATGVMFNVLP